MPPKEDVDQGPSTEETEGSGAADSASTLKRKYSEREPESPGQLEPVAAFPSDNKKERTFFCEGTETDSPASYPKHVIVPSGSEKQGVEPYNTNVTQSPEDQRTTQGSFTDKSSDQGAQVLTPDSINRGRPTGSYDSQPINYRHPYHDVYRTPSYNPDMDYGRGSYANPSANNAHPPPGDNYVRSRRWACDICNVATFASYEEACAHEEVCSRRYHNQQYQDPRHGAPQDYNSHRGSIPPAGSGLGALYHASQEVVTPPTPHRHSSDRWGNCAHGPPLPVFPHEQGYYGQGQYDMREEPSQQYYEPRGYTAGSHPPQQQQAPYSPHHPRQHQGGGSSLDYYQKRMLLAMPSDRDSLSDRQCYVRSEMVEIFAATDKDVAARHSKGAQKLIIGQVGIRCVHCSHLRPRDRAERAVCYPSSISRIYQTVADMQRFHFEQCREIPEHVRQIYKKLKTTRPRGVGSPQTYWMSSAKQLGLVDTESGIRFDGEMPTGKDPISAL